MADKVVISEKWELISKDVSSWAKNAAIFFVPVLGIYVAFVLVQFQQDGFAWSDFAPNLIVQGSMVAYIVNEAWALIKKWYDTTSYKPS